jgi:anti-sigma-K factor RskA
MTCLSVDHKPDWKAYALGELDAESRRQAEAHASACASCREELDAVRVTLDALSTLREEETKCSSRAGGRCSCALLSPPHA